MISSRFLQAVWYVQYIYIFWGHLYTICSLAMIKLLTKSALRKAFFPQGDSSVQSLWKLHIYRGQQCEHQHKKKQNAHYAELYQRTFKRPPFFFKGGAVRQNRLFLRVFIGNFDIIHLFHLALNFCIVIFKFIVPYFCPIYNWHFQEIALLDLYTIYNTKARKLSPKKLCIPQRKFPDKSAINDTFLTLSWLTVGLQYGII